MLATTNRATTIIYTLWLFFSPLVKPPSGGVCTQARPVKTIKSDVVKVESGDHLNLCNSSASAPDYRTNELWAFSWNNSRTECRNSNKKFNLGGQTSFTFYGMFLLLLFFRQVLFSPSLHRVRDGRKSEGDEKKNDTFAEQFNANEDTLNSSSILWVYPWRFASDVTPRQTHHLSCKYFNKAEGKQDAGKVESKTKHTQKHPAKDFLTALHNIIP